MAGGMVIVGAGECGTRAAFALREHGYDGPVTLIGDEPHLPYERPPLSKDAMLAEGGIVPKYIADEIRLRAANIDHRSGVRVSAIDREARTVATDGSERLSYDRLLLATGSTPRRLSHNGAEVPHVSYLRNLVDAKALRTRLTPGMKVILIGAGFIGLELAAGARQLGAVVTVIEVLPRILARVVPEPISAVIAERHRREGTAIITGATIATIETGPASVRVTLADGHRFDADLLIAGIGAIPITGLASAAGLAIDNGIAVDTKMQTADPAILAAGDCCSFPLEIYGGRRVRLEAWRTAQELGTLAARNMLGHDVAYDAVPWFWSDQFDLTLQISGLPDEGRSTVRRDLGNGAFLLFHLADDGRLVSASGIGTGNTVARDIRLAEMLIARRAHPDPAQLTDPAVRLRAVLAAT
jgi:3-phenylpropionate/trans-cinnamate dioxygenase ferredoxin reductase component